MSREYIHLGLNIDHIATLRNARNEGDPSLLELAFEAQDGGADSFTMHLREDRRHIKDKDIFEIKEHAKLPINLEMAISEEMTKIALQLKPRSVCIVPERRLELTTEGGLDVNAHFAALRPLVQELQAAEIEVFPFVEPDLTAIDLCHTLGCNGVELHTGAFARGWKNIYERHRQVQRLQLAAEHCAKLKLELHIGHGLNYANIGDVLNLPGLTEVNIGHAIIARALKTGLRLAVAEMKALLEKKV